MDDWRRERYSDRESRNSCGEKQAKGERKLYDGGAYIMLKLNFGHLQWTKIILEESFGATCGPSISSDYNPRETILAA